MRLGLVGGLEVATLAQILFAGSVSVLASGLAFLVWWMFDQRQDWVLIANPKAGVVSIEKHQAGKDKLRLEYDGEEATVPLEPDKTLYRPGWRAGRFIAVDISKGVQLALDSGCDTAVGYEAARVIDADLGTTWRNSYVEEGMGLTDFLRSYGVVILFVVVGVVVAVSMTGGV